jgi:hypothetical protein
MEMNQQGGSISFIVRIWLESGSEPGEERRWRGHIRHVQSGKDVYFQDLRQMADFIESLSGSRFSEGGTAR